LAEADGKEVNLRGFYIHAGHSYGGSKPDDARRYLQTEVDAGVLAVQTWEKLSSSSSEEEMIISIGATPTAHVISTISSSSPLENLNASSKQKWKFEIHAGNFPINDLQQLSTSVLPPPYESQQPLALTINAEVISVYAHRNEALINAER